jgi:PAS domain S-box-containing protein
MSETESADRPDLPPPLLEEPELRRVLALLETVTSAASLLLCAVDTELRVTYFNAAYRLEIMRLTGRKIRAGDRIPELFDHLPEQKGVVEAEWARVLRGEASSERIEFGDPGVWRRTYLSRRIPLRDRDGRLSGAASVGFDITDQVRAEEALAWKEARASAVLASLSEGVVVLDGEGKVSRVNDAALRLFGCRREDLGDPAGPFLRCTASGGDGAPVPFEELPVVASLRTGAAFQAVPLEIAAPDGSRKWISMNSRPVLGADGSLLGAVASFFDITDLKSKERELADAAAKFRTVADHTSDWEWWVGPDGAFLYCSPSCEAVTGHRREAFLADPLLFERIVHPEDREDFRERHRGRLECRSRGRASFRIVRPDGVTRWVENAWIPVVEEGDRFLGSRGSIRDVTDRVEAEALQRLADRYEAVGKLAGGVAHKINNLMTVVVGYSSAMLREMPEEEPAHVAFEEIGRAGEEAAEITSRLLSYSRRQMFAPRVVELGALLGSMRKILDAIVGGRGEIRVLPAAEELYVEVDRNQFRRAVEELVTNGRDALAPAGGCVKVRWGRRDVSEGEDPAPGVPVRPGSYGVVEVCDDGCGMDDRFLPSALDPFTTTKGTGRGLGLPSVYGFARQSDGYLALSSRRGEGTVASLFFPLWCGRRGECGAARNGDGGEIPAAAGNAQDGG